MEHLDPEPQIHENTLICREMRLNKAAKRIGNSFKKGKVFAWRITFISVLVLGVILIGRPLYSLIKTSMEVRSLKREKALYEESIRRDSTLINNLKNDDFLERYAREKFFMHNAGEDVFIIE